MAGWLDQLEIRLNSASVAVEVEVEAELGRIKKISLKTSLRIKEKKNRLKC